MKRHFLSLISLCYAVSAMTQTISSSVFFPDAGVSCEIEDVITDTACWHFELADPTETAFWRLGIYTVTGRDTMVVETQTMQKNIEFRPRLFHKWSTCARFYELYDVLFHGYIEILNSSRQIVERKELSFNLLPQIPKFENISYFIDSSEQNIYRMSGEFSFHIIGARTDIFRTLRSAPYMWPDDEIKFLGVIQDYPPHEQAQHTHVYDEYSPWGRFYKTIAMNDFGAVYSDTICTTDYILDEDVLQRIYASREQAAIHHPQNSSMSINICNLENSIHINGYNLAKAIIRDSFGRILFETPLNDEDNYIEWPDTSSGLYFISVTTTDNQLITKKLIKQ